MTKFNVGDWVRANDDAVDQFTKGKIYKVIDPCDKYGDVLVEVDDRGSKTNGWGEDKFDLVRRADEPWQVGDVVGWKDNEVWQNCAVTKVGDTDLGGLAVWATSDNASEEGLFVDDMLYELRLIETAPKHEPIVFTNEYTLNVEPAKLTSHEPSYKEIDLVAQKANVNIKDTNAVWQAIADSGFVIVKR